MAILFPKVSRATIGIDSVKTIVSTCPNNGSITVYAQSTDPLILYSIVSGPATEPAQTDRVFNSLPPGSYTVKVTNGIGESATQNITVNGTYVPLDFNPLTTSPYCVGNTNGQIIGNPVVNTGNAPYTWQLIPPSPVTTSRQSSDTFNNLAAGNYTMRLADACGSFRTIVATVPVPNTQMIQYSATYIEKAGCDSSWVTSGVQMQPGEVRLPLSIKFKTKNGIYIPAPGSTQIDSSHVSSEGIIFLRQLVPGVSYGDTVISVIYNTCGDSLVLLNASTPYTFSPQYSFNNCGTFVTAWFNYADIETPYYGLKPPVTYTFVDTATNVLTDSGTIAGDPAPALYYNIIEGIGIKPALPVGETYKLTVTDGCGEVFTQNYTTPTLAQASVVRNDILYSPCIDSVLGVYRIQTAGFGENPILILLSGPLTVESTKPGFAYTDTYNYPDTVGGGEYFFLNNLTVGTYQYKITDDCGHEVFDSIVVDPSEIIGLSWNASYQKGCLGQNKIYYTLSHQNSLGFVPVSAGTVIVRNISTGAVVRNQVSYSGVYNDSVLNVPSGQYEITFEFQEPAYGTSINRTYTSCWTTKDTITIAGYQTPAIASSNYILCHNTIHIELLPDSTKGVPPYQYEIVSGPQIFPTQDSNVFSVTQAGTYIARIFDVCGNASTAQVTVSSIAFPPINRIAPNCNGTQLFYGSSPYFTYQWTKPNGTNYAGDTLTIVPVTPADTGVYTIRKIVNIDNCTDTVYTSYHLSLIASHTQTIGFCNGTVVHVGSHTYNTPGTYVDTLSSVNALGCDSVVTTVLVVMPQKRDTNNITVCKGSNIVIGTNTYNTSGIYEDSVLNASGCYDLKFTNLIVKQLRDTVNATICSLGSITVGTHVYNTAGTYIDTLQSSQTGCDSIVVLNLSVNPLDIFVIDDTDSEVICQGDSLGFGTTLYTQSGIYQDTLVEGCTGIVLTVNVTVNPYKRDTITTTICQPQSYTVGTHTYSTSGIYHDTLSTATCDSIVVLNLTANSCSTPGTVCARDTVNQSICEGDSLVSNGKAYTQTGIYQDTLSTATCDSIVILNLTVNPYKRDSIVQSICTEQNYIIGAHTYTLTGIYHDTLSTATCDSIVVLNLTVNSCSSSGIICARDTINQFICEGDSLVFNGKEYTQTGLYSDTLTTVTCDSIATLNLMTYPDPSVSIFPSATEVDQGDVVELNVTPPLYNYLWIATGASLNDNTIQEPKATINTASWIYVIVTDPLNGCYSEDSVFITLKVTTPCSGASHIYIPTAFTPNGDGLNDLFRILGDNIILNEFEIYNRWGQMVFETKDISQGWDGTYDGEMLAGNYVYWVSYSECGGDVKILKGNILLIR